MIYSDPIYKDIFYCPAFVASDNLDALIENREAERECAEVLLRPFIRTQGYNEYAEAQACMFHEYEA